MSLSLKCGRDIGARVNTDYWELKYCKLSINWIIGTSHITTCSTGTLHIETKIQRERKKKSVQLGFEPGHSL